VTVWIADVGPLGLLARVFDAGQPWPPGVLHVVRAVHGEAYGDGKGPRALLLDATTPEGPVVEVHDFEPGSAAQRMLDEYLRPDPEIGDKDEGEHASIALCVHEAPEAMFVTTDKPAAYLALAELGPGRVATPFDLWADLRGRGLVSQEAFEALCDGTRKRFRLPGVPERVRAAARAGEPARG